MILHVPALDDSVDDELTLGMGTELELLEAAGAATKEANIVRYSTDTDTYRAHPVAEAMGGGVQAGQGG